MVVLVPAYRAISLVRVLRWFEFLERGDSGSNLTLWSSHQTQDFVHKLLKFWLGGSVLKIGIEFLK